MNLEVYVKSLFIVRIRQFLYYNFCKESQSTILLESMTVLKKVNQLRRIRSHRTVFSFAHALRYVRIRKNFLLCNKKMSNISNF